MHEMPQEIKKVIAHLDIDQISDEAKILLEKVDRQELLTKKQREMLLNPTEVAAVLSVKYKRPIKHRYVKEISRSVTNQNTGHTTPARLAPDKVAGRTFLYKANQVLQVRMRQPQVASS